MEEIQPGKRKQTGGGGATLPGFPGTVRVGQDGDLLNHLSIGQNLSLPLEYHGRDVRRIAEDVPLLFALCGEDKADLSRFLQQYPDALSAYERRLAGFIRALLLEPEVLVLDDILDGLTDKEKEKAMQWERAFRLRFPFRRLLHGAGEVA